ncbi:MAG: sugar phosphate isomerase/epimerase [Acidobacteria bacterium]|nr:sugar phosphate isomerase/epimerase [Acidobacteriota bacterium]
MNNPLLLHSVSYAGLWGQAFLPVEGVLDKAVQLGFDGVMLMAKRPHTSVLDWGPRERELLREQLAQRNLRHLCLAGYCNLTADLEHGEIPHRELQVTYLLELVKLTHELGGTLLRVFTGYEHPTADPGRQTRLIIETLKETAQRAAMFGVTLGIQNHHDHAVDWQSLHDLIHAIGEPNCQACYDAWAPALQGVDLRTAARAMAPMTVHTTTADYQLRPRFRYRPDLVNYEVQTPSTLAVPMGEGLIDYPGFLKALDENGFTGSIAYEMCSPLRDGRDMDTLDRYARRFVDYLRAL